MKDKAFAAKVNRDDIVRGAERLDMPLEELIAEVIAAVQTEGELLGVAGQPQQSA
jgi:predicted hydrolase (HD superfamily)